MDTVEALLRKQEDFEKMLAAQEEKFYQLNRETKVEERDRKRREEEEQRRKELEDQRLKEELVRKCVTHTPSHHPTLTPSHHPAHTQPNSPSHTIFHTSHPHTLTPSQERQREGEAETGGGS